MENTETPTADAGSDESRVGRIDTLEPNNPRAVQLGLIRATGLLAEVWSLAQQFHANGYNNEGGIGELQEALYTTLREIERLSPNSD